MAVLFLIIGCFITFSFLNGALEAGSWSEEEVKRYKRKYN